MDYVVHRFERLVSTNDTAIQMAKDGAPEGTVVIAEEQTFGRGRLDRKWLSPRGGLYLSLILRPPRQLHDMWQLAFVGSLGVVDAIRSAVGLEAGVKWPNDLVIGSKKVGGLLVEVLPGCTAVVGIGVNVNILEFPDELCDLATSLALEAGSQIDIEYFIGCLLLAFKNRYYQYLEQGFGLILGDWKIHDTTVGRKVRVSTPDGLIDGCALDVDAQGRLIIEATDGRIHTACAGDLRPLS